MHAENLLVDQGSHGQTVEHITEYAPESDRVSSFALIVEAIDTIDLGALVIAAEQEEVLGVLDLVAQKQAHSLDRLLSTVDVVTQKQVVRFGRETSVLEDPQQVIVLAMHVTY